MGDRVSIQFVDSQDTETPVLCHHWGGKWFPQAALKFAKDFQKQMKSKRAGGCSTPFSRMEPRVILVKFIEAIAFQTKDEDNGLDGVKGIGTSVYLAVDTQHCDNSDNGHFVIHLDPTKPITMKHTKGEFEA